MIKIGTEVVVKDIFRTDAYFSDLSLILGETGIVVPSSDPDDPDIGLVASSPKGFVRGRIMFDDDIGSFFFDSIKVEEV